MTTAVSLHPGPGGPAGGSDRPRAADGGSNATTTGAVGADDGCPASRRL